MYRITYEGSMALAVAVCHTCKAQAPATIWGAHQDSHQCIKPSGWGETVEREGRQWMLRLLCGLCAK